MLALTAIGKDPRNVAGFDLLLPQTTEFAHCELREGKSAAAERFAACQATADKLL